MGIEALLAEHFGLENCKIKKTVGYANANYIVSTDQNKFILKTYQDYTELKEIVDAESQILVELTSQDSSAPYPRPIPFNDGALLKVLEIEGKSQLVRMLSFLEGEFMGDRSVTIQTAHSIGAFMANLNVQLRPLNQVVYQARQWEWDIQYLHLVKEFADHIEGEHNKHVVRYFIQQFETNVKDELPFLRKQLIHNDANEWNILVDGDQISGIIDFGDMAHSPLIHELAVAATYVAYRHPDPASWVKEVARAYHKILPLESREIDLLYYLIAARLCLSVCNSAHSKAKDPENSYATVSEKYAWDMLHNWLKVNPKRFAEEVKEAVGLSPNESTTLDEALNQRKKHLSDILSVSYSRPIYMDRAAFQYMYDQSGHTFLDAYNNIPHVGHCHPHVVEAGQKQMARLNTNTRYVFDLLHEYAEQLLEKFPASLNKVFFVNSGSAASDLAIRLVRSHTGSNRIMVMEHGYHGNTQLGMDVSDYKFSNPKGQGQQHNILKAQLPDTFRGRYSGPNAGTKYATDTIQQIQEAESLIGAFMSEPIVGCGGQIPLAPGYLEPVYRAIRAKGGLCISDEVQTGFGRIGDHFWGYEMQGVVPDLVILGKPMGNGHPIGAVVTTEEVAASFEKGVEFFSSFGGNPVSCAIGLSVLQVIEAEGLQNQAKEVGSYYQEQLRQLGDIHACIGDVRGSGLFIGVDIVKPGTLGTDQTMASHIKNYLRDQHILISTDGPDDSVIKTKPPLCFTKSNVDHVVAAMDDAIQAFRN